MNKQLKRESKPRMIPREHKVPEPILLHAARSVIDETGYGADSLSTYNDELIRTRCGPKYSSIPPCDIHQQVISLRKKGLLPVDGKNGQPSIEDLGRAGPSWYRSYLRSDWWVDFRETVYYFWGYRCALCGTPESKVKKLEMLSIHHNKYKDEKGSILGRETIADVICICTKCHKRHHRWQPMPPKRKPS